VIYCFFTGRRIILLHGFQKKTQKTPERELETARRRYEDWLLRHESLSRLLGPPDGRSAFHRAYVEEGARKDLWLQLVEARQTARLTQAELAQRLGVSQAQVARIERRGYDAQTLRTPRRQAERPPRRATPLTRPLPTDVGG